LKNILWPNKGNHIKIKKTKDEEDDENLQDDELKEIITS